MGDNVQMFNPPGASRHKYIASRTLATLFFFHAAGFAAGLSLFSVPSVRADAGGADITYTLPRAAKVSLNVLDGNGWIVRELLRADQEDAGQHTVHWDGNDPFGRPQPPGSYTWKLLDHTGLKADYVLSVGNSGQPPYRTDDNKGSWGACHGNPMSVQADATGLYLTWMTQEGNAVFAHTDYDGHALYKIDNSQGWGRNWDSIIVGNTLYRLEDSNIGSFLEKYDVQTGKFTNWDVKNAQVSGGKLRIQHDPLVPPDPKAPKNEAKRRLFEDDAKAIAANATYVVASFPAQNKIAIFKATGEALPDLEIDQPHGLLFLPDGRLLVAQPGKVVAINLEDRSTQPFLTQNLDNPWGLTLARDGKTLWVTDQGKSNQVKQFGFDGKLLAAFGQPGGMPTEGTIDHLSFYMPRGIACGVDGNIYVTEDSPLRRISRWSPEGKLLREWFGPEGPQRSCWPNLSDFSEVYYHSSINGFIQCKVDLEKKTWYPVAWSQILIKGNQPCVFESHGHKFLYNGHDLLLVFDPKSNHWQPALEFSYSDKDRSSSLWTDLNGNGQADDGETQTISAADLKAKTQLTSIVPSFGQFDPATLVFHGVMGGEAVVLEPSKITGQGIPVYTIEKIKRLTQKPARGDDGWTDEMSYSVHGVVPAADGGFFTAYNGGRQGFTRAWDRASWSYLVKFGADGRIQWQVGVHAPDRNLANPHDIGMVMRVAGLSKDVVFLTDVEANFHAYTSDGLYVDALLDPSTSRSLSPNSLTVENVTGLVAEDPATHETYLFAGSTEDSRVWRITGFDSFQRLQGGVTLKTAETPPATDTYTIAATKPPRQRIAGDLGADGFLNEPEWRQADELPLVDDGVLKARIYLRHDDQYLWIGAHVIDSSPAENSSQDAEMAFIHGDCLDLYFGADAAADAKRDAAGIGDVRILLYPSGNTKMYNGAIVAYRMKVADGTEKHPFEFASPAGSVTADSVVPIEGKDSVTGRGLCTFYRWPSGAGYTVEAKIPLSALPELGLDVPAPADHKIAFDAGVIFSNDAGTDRASRLYWHQEDSRTQTVMDLPTEAQFYPRLWGAAVVKSVIAPGGKP